MHTKDKQKRNKIKCRRFCTIVFDPKLVQVSVFLAISIDKCYLPELKPKSNLAQPQEKIRKTLAAARNRLRPSEENLCHFVRISIQISKNLGQNVSLERLFNYDKFPTNLGLKKDPD